MCIRVFCYMLDYVFMMLGGCSRCGEGVIPKVVPPYSVKGLWDKIQRSLRSAPEICIVYVGLVVLNLCAYVFLYV